MIKRTLYVIGAVAILVLLLAAEGCPLLMFLNFGGGDDTIDGKVVGSITLPDVAEGSSYDVYIGNDYYTEAGRVASSNGVCGTGTTIDYELFDVPAGTYYLWASVDTDESGDLTWGDFLGWYGGSGAWPPAAVNATVPDIGEVVLDFSLAEYGNFGGTTTISGTVTMPAAAEGNNYTIIIETDFDPTTGSIAVLNGVCGDGTTFDYSISTVPGGTYFVYAFIDMDDSLFLTTGDYLGWYGGSGSMPPAEVNAVVPDSGSVVFDFPVGVYGEALTTVNGTITLPEVAEGKQYSIYIDTDFDLVNGYTAIEEGACDSTLTIDYSIGEISEGSYFVFAFVDIDSSGGYTSFDFLGVYGGDPVTPNAVVPSSGSVTFDFSLDPGDEIAGAIVMGTITLPNAVEDMGCFVGLDDDGDGSNGHVATVVILGISGTTFDYAIYGVPEGIYFLRASIELVEPSGGGPSPGDYFGTYGYGLDGPDPNVVVPASGTITLDFSLLVWPEE